MARLRRHGPADRRRGFYVDGGQWTLRTTPAADRFFRTTPHYDDGSGLPVVVVRTLVHLGEARAPWTPKATLLERFPRLHPAHSGASAAALGDLRAFAERRLREVGLPEAELAALDEFLREQTPLETFGADEAYLR